MGLEIKVKHLKSNLLSKITFYQLSLRKMHLIKIGRHTTQKALIDPVLK